MAVQYTIVLSKPYLDMVTLEYLTACVHGVVKAMLRVSTHVKNLVGEKSRKVSFLVGHRHRHQGSASDLWLTFGK